MRRSHTMAWQMRTCSVRPSGGYCTSGSQAEVTHSAATALSWLFLKVLGVCMIKILFLISAGSLSVMKTSSGIMSLLGKPEWRWRNWRWTRRKTSTCVSRESSLCVKLDYIQTTLCSPCLNLLLTCCNLVPPHRQRELQPPGEPEASLSTKMRQCFLISKHV